MKNSLFVFALLFASPFAVALETTEQQTKFIDKMVQQHQFERAELDAIFKDVKKKDSIIKAISRPAEKSIPWYKYRNIFLKQSRINGGVKFWNNNEAALKKAEQDFGVPAEIIVAILGVETKYGGNMGGYRVIDALSTLAFYYPKRSAFFTKELEKFLILTRDENMSRFEPVGSYAGAMGLGQFMPSSYLAYAIDFDGDGHRDIWTNPTDAIGSIANYLKQHGWVRNESIVHQSSISKQPPAVMLKNSLKPSFTREQLISASFTLDELPEGSDLLSVATLTQKKGEEYWLGRQNFYAITRYNHSRMYAMAVYQLAEAIKAKRTK